MPETHPLIVLNAPRVAPRLRPRSGGGSKLHQPGYARQGQRFNAYFERFEQKFDERTAEIVETLNGVEPEHVIVLETIGTIEDFYKAAGKIPGLEWLFEFDGEEIDSNADFYYEDDEGDDDSTKLKTRLYLVMSNRQGLQDLIRIWNIYRTSGVLPRKQAKWRDLFNQLNDIRFWDQRDRLSNTGLELALAERTQTGENVIRIELELWYRNNPQSRTENLRLLTELITEVEGRVLSTTDYEAIRYQGLLVELPIAAVTRILAFDQTISLLKSDNIMYFRPSGQALFLQEATEGIHSQEVEATVNQPLDVPFVALFDGLPVSNHQDISTHITIDDPDNFSESYPVAHRFHGTAMASLIINGDLERPHGGKLPRRIYVRPILKSHAFSETHISEVVPEELLVTDVIHSAVQRMFEGDAPVATSVKIINLSVAEKFRPFIDHISPLARMLDYLSHKHNILFVISAGNYGNDLRIPMPSRQFEELGIGNRQSITLQSMTSNLVERRILAPAESINSITVGSCFDDNSEHRVSGFDVLMMNSKDVHAPYSCIGLGVRNSIKPDILAPGGMSVFRSNISDVASSTYTMIQRSSRSPGQKVAHPSNQLGTVTHQGYMQGTSNSAALVSRLGGFVLEQLVRIGIPNDFQAILTKSLIVHGAMWGEAKTVLNEVPPALIAVRKKNWINRLIGYGKYNPERSIFCDDHRATVVRYGSIVQDDSHTYEIPLPDSLSGAATLKRLVVTLAWFTPIEPKSRKYRKAQLSFTVNGHEDTLNPSRINSDWQTVKRGTVQHEIFEGYQIRVFAENSTIKVVVICKLDATKLDSPVRYGLSVTLESADRAVTNIYDQVRTRIPVPIPIPITARTRG